MFLKVKEGYWKQKERAPRIPVVSKLTSKIRSTEKQVHKITAPIPSFIFNSGFILLLYIFIVIIILNVL